MQTSIPVLAGPTAVGKTRLSLELAKLLDAEIVSFDSRQIYRGMTIGTAKPSTEELGFVRHHFIDERDIDEPISAGAYAAEAWKRIEEIYARGRQVVAVGGSTLYLQTLTRGMADIPEVSPEVRDRLMERLESEGGEALYRELEHLDPVSAKTMDSTKTQRLVRALEVVHQTGRPLSYFHERHVPPPFNFEVMVLSRPRDILYERIDRRVDLMLEEGLLDEVLSILARGYSSDEPALQTIGYREAIAHIRGEYDHAEMVRLIKRNSRRYAKRQLTWFRRDEEYRWIEAETSARDLLRVHASAS